jgi:hypothetical protein
MLILASLIKLFYLKHLSCLSYLVRHFAVVAAASSSNKMTARNLAIVITPSIFPIQVSVPS